MKFRGFLLCLLGVAALGGGCALLHALLGLPDVPTVRPKLERFLEEKETFDTVFFGSSHFYHQIDPALFDRLTAERGAPTRSFNFGVDGMMSGESFFCVNRLLEEKPAGLRWVFMEFTPIIAGFPPENVPTLRAVYWHDWEQTWTVTQRAWLLFGQTRKQTAWERAQQIVPDLLLHWRLCAKNEGNLGRIQWINPEQRAAVREAARATLGPNRDGYLPTGRRISPAELARFRQALAERKAAPPRLRPLDEASAAAYTRLAARVRQAGAQLILLTAPSPLSKSKPSPETISPPPPWFNFNEMPRYPELFTEAVRMDADHLNEAGAAVWTRRIAERFLAEVAPAAGR
jgi:hypothetical protein